MIGDEDDCQDDDGNISQPDHGDNKNPPVVTKDALQKITDDQIPAWLKGGV